MFAKHSRVDKKPYPQEVISPHSDFNVKTSPDNKYFQPVFIIISLYPSQLTQYLTGIHSAINLYGTLLRTCNRKHNVRIYFLFSVILFGFSTSHCGNDDNIADLTNSRDTTEGPVNTTASDKTAKKITDQEILNHILKELLKEIEITQTAAEVKRVEKLRAVDNKKQKHGYELDDPSFAPFTGKPRICNL